MRPNQLSGSGGVSVGVVLSNCQISTFVALVKVSIQLLFRIKYHIYLVLLDGAVSQFMVEIPRTVNGQHGVEFDFQSI